MHNICNSSRFVVEKMHDAGVLRRALFVTYKAIKMNLKLVFWSTRTQGGVRDSLARVAGEKRGKMHTLTVLGSDTGDHPRTEWDDRMPNVRTDLCISYKYTDPERRKQISYIVLFLQASFSLTLNPEDPSCLCSTQTSLH